MTPTTWAILCHVTSFTGYLGNGIGFVIGPLVIWLIKKDELPEVALHGKESLNFNLSILIYQLILIVFLFVTFGIGAVLAVPAIMLLVVVHIVCTIRAAIAASQGKVYRYPLNMNLIK